MSINHFPNKCCLIAFSDVMMRNRGKPLTSKEIGIGKSWKLGRGKAGRREPKGRENTSWCWEVGREICCKGHDLSAGSGSERKTWIGGKKMNTSLSSPNITLSFFPLFHKNAWEEESRTCFPRAKALFGSSWRLLLEDLEQCYLPHTRRAKHRLTHRPSWESAGSPHTPTPTPTCR